MWRPRLLCTLQHSSQIRIPLFMDAQQGSAKEATHCNTGSNTTLDYKSRVQNEQLCLLTSLLCHWVSLRMWRPCLGSGCWENGKHQSWHSWGKWDSKDSGKICSGNLGRSPTASSSSCENTFLSKHNRTLNLSLPSSALFVILWTPIKVFQTTVPTCSFKKLCFLFF